MQAISQISIAMGAARRTRGGTRSVIVAIRIAEAARQIQGKAGRHQINNARTALGHAASGFAMMYQTVLVLGQNKDGALA